MERPVNEQITRYALCCLPLGHSEARLFTVNVEWRGSDRWSIGDGFQVYGHDNTWDSEPLPSSRTDEWIANYRWALDDALPVARKLAREMKINGYTIEMVLAKEHSNDE